MRQLDGRPDGRAGGDAHQHTLGMADQLAGGEGVVVRDGDDLVIDLRIQHVGDKARADALDLVAAGVALAQDGGILRLDGDDLDVRILLFQISARAGDGTAGADARDEDVDLSVGVLPDLGAGGCLMGGGVGGVDELSGDEAIRDLLRQLVGLGVTKNSDCEDSLLSCN